MKLFLARIISLVFNPFLILVFLPFFLVLKSSENVSTSIYWAAYSSIFLIGLGLVVFYMVKKGIFTDLDVSLRKQRPRLFNIIFGVAFLYLLGLYIFHAPRILFAMIFSLIFGVLVAKIINVRIKASLHVATVSALILGLVLGFGVRFIFLLLLIPLIGWSRVKLKRHTVSEVVTGGVVGSLLLLFLYAFFEIFWKV